jgi:hypothetical protein
MGRSGIIFYYKTWEKIMLYLEANTLDNAME